MAIVAFCLAPRRAVFRRPGRGPWERVADPRAVWVLVWSGEPKRFLDRNLMEPVGAAMPDGSESRKTVSADPWGRKKADPDLWSFCGPGERKISDVAFRCQASR